MIAASQCRHTGVQLRFVTKRSFITRRRCLLAEQKGSMTSFVVRQPMGSFTLPDNFLSEEAPNIVVERVNFKKTPLPEYDGLYAVILDNVLTERECQQMRAAAEATTNGIWERATVNVGGGNQKLMKMTRNCGRIIWDSRDVVAKIWRRIEHISEVQEIVRLEKEPHIFGNGPQKRGEVWKFTRLNERMRFLKYEGGEYFRPHCDGTYETPDGKERSYFTLHLYLNNAGGLSDTELAELPRADQAKVLAVSGGATTFHSITSLDKTRDFGVASKTGRILLFQHRDLLHSGEDVIAGVKYTMRTDLMYALESSKKDGRSKTPTPES